MIIKILGSGCPNCKKLEMNTKKALKELNLDATVEKVEDFEKIMAYGVMSTPALVVDEEVKFSGRVASPKDIIKYLQ
ncbi:thioredoxin family protein [Vallitaleaceae bacterium 9-2]